AVNPTTGAILRDYAEPDAAEIDRRLSRSVRAFESWRRTSLAERATRVRAAAGVLRRDREALARLMTLEMGKPIAQAEGEVDKCAWACDHFAEHGPAALAPESIASDASRSGVRFDPLGVVLAVMPWNFPLWQVFRAAVPALMAGNGVVLKHASNVPGSA